MFLIKKKSYPIFKLDKESFVGTKVLNKNENRNSLNTVNIPPTRRLYFIERAQVEQKASLNILDF